MGKTEFSHEYRLAMQNSSLAVFSSFLDNGVTVMRGDHSELTFVSFSNPQCSFHLSKSVLSDAVIAGIVAGAVAAVIILTTALACLVKYNRKRRLSKWARIIRLSGEQRGFLLVQDE